MNEQANKIEDPSVFSIPAGAMSRGVQGGPTGVCVMNYKVTGTIADKLRSLQEFYRDPSVYFVVAPGEEATQDPVAAKRVWFSLETPADRIWVVIPSEKVETIGDAGQALGGLKEQTAKPEDHSAFSIPAGAMSRGIEGGDKGAHVLVFPAINHAWRGRILREILMRNKDAYFLIHPEQDQGLTEAAFASRTKRHEETPLGQLWAVCPGEGTTWDPEVENCFFIPKGHVRHGIYGGDAGARVRKYGMRNSDVNTAVSLLQSMFDDHPTVRFLLNPQALANLGCAKNPHRLVVHDQVPVDETWALIPSVEPTPRNHIFVPQGYTISGFDGGATGLHIRKFHINDDDETETLLRLRELYADSRFLVNPAVLDSPGSCALLPCKPVASARVPTCEVWVLTPHDETDADVNPIVGRIAKTPSGLSFSDALVALKEGKRVARAGWNGRSMHLWLLPAATVKAEWCREPHLKAIAEANGGEVECLGSIRMLTADKKVLTGWLASQSDILAEDWIILPEDNA